LNIAKSSKIELLQPVSVFLNGRKQTL